jgi:tetratricopeptide (TPR) repeat protein
MKVDPLLASEFARDEGTVRGVLALIEGRWTDAADLLGAARRNSPLPVVTRAWRRAAYLGRRFGEVAASRPPPGSREGVGAALALALESDSPGRELLKILESPGTDDEATLTLATALARLETGQDPRPWVTLGMNLLGTRLSDDPERRSILEAARLQWLSGSGEDDEARYEQAIRSLGDEPRSWSGRLAAIELRLGLGARLARRRADARSRFEEAVRLSDRLSRQAPEWSSPRILRATARARLGQLDDAWSEIEALLGRPRVPVRALLVASGVWLQRGERNRRSHLPWEGEARKAREWAMKVLSALPDHPGALTLAAAASILLAQAEAAAGRDESELVDGAVAELGRALAAQANSGEALFHRGRALFLRAEIARRAGRPSATDMVRSLEDLDLALRWIPDLLSARYMRGIARFTAGTYDGALDDWTLVLKADPSWDSGELQEWIREARSGLKK